MRQNLMYKAYVWLITTIRDNGPMTLSEINSLWIKDKVNECDALKQAILKQVFE